MRLPINISIAFVTAAVFALPAAAFAQSWVTEVSNSGSVVHSQTSASASTGGQTVTGGDNVSTGNASASVSTQTVIESGNGTSTADVQMTTSQNGHTSTTSVHKEVPAGEPLEIHIATSSGSSVAARSTVRVSAGTVAATSTEMASSSSSTPAAARIGQWLTAFLQSVKGWFSFF